MVSYVDAPDEAATAVYVSPQIEELIGFSVEEWMADPDLWPRVLHPDDRARALAENVRHNETGEPFELVHNSGHDSQWDRTVTIAPGDSMLFNVPIFGLRPADYYHYFVIEYRDSKNRSYWTRQFDLCALASTCACPGRGATSAGGRATQTACPSEQPASAVLGEKPREISLVCR